MPEFNRPESPAQFEANFEQLKPLMTATQSYYESSRCLFCYDAPCVTACPTGIDIPLFIRQINAHNELGAAKTIYDSNYFGYACGKVCPTEVLCEGACVYNHQGVKPIEIGRLQSFATGQAIASGKALYEIPASTLGKVAIIGAGPAGISCACELSRHGIEVDIYEAKARPSGLTIHGVAPYKITNEEVMQEMDYLQAQFGFNIIYNHPVRTKADLTYLENNYSAILLGIGLGTTSELHIPGEEMKNVFGAVEIIEQIRKKHHQFTVPSRIIVLGGGNTAMDAASESARLGAEEVTLAYRRSKGAMGAYEFEYDLAKGVGVKGLFNAAPVSINGDGKAESVTFVCTTEINGKLENIPGSEFTIACDWVIKATGQAKMTDFLSLIDGLQFDNKGRIIVNEHFQTTNPKYFAGGDAVSGGKEVVNAAAEGKKAAKSIIKHIL